jgi:hypothetical protein
MPKYDFHDYKNMPLVESNPLFMPFLWLFMSKWHKWWVLLNYIVVRVKSWKSCFGIMHVFLHDYFMHMWFAPRARNFEPNEYKQLTKWQKKKSFPL